MRDISLLGHHVTKVEFIKNMSRVGCDGTYFTGKITVYADDDSKTELTLFTDGPAIEWVETKRYDLEFKPTRGKREVATIKFANALGASVLKEEDHRYEVAIINHDERIIAHELMPHGVVGWLTIDEVNEWLAKIEDLPA